MKWISVYTTYGQLEAEIMKGFLEAQGVNVEISQESVAKTMGLTAGKLGEVQVLVPEDQVQAALDCIQEMESGKFEVPPSPETE